MKAGFVIQTMENTLSSLAFEWRRASTALLCLKAGEMLNDHLLPSISLDGAKFHPFHRTSQPHLLCHPHCSTHTRSIPHFCWDVLLAKKLVLNIQWVLGYPNPDYVYTDVWTLTHVDMFLVPAGRIHVCCDHWSFATGESKAAVRTTFPNAKTLFHAVRDLVHNLQRPSN